MIILVDFFFGNKKNTQQLIDIKFVMDFSITIHKLPFGHQKLRNLAGTRKKMLRLNQIKTTDFIRKLMKHFFD